MVRKSRYKRRAHPLDTKTVDVTTRTHVFISYRRDDTQDIAEFLERSLTERLGKGSIFRDVVTLQPGDKFPEIIEKSISECSAFIALIGPRWLTAKERTGERRLDGRGDFVRREIELALERKVPVIPVLVDGASMPSRGQLPRSIAALAEHNAYTLPWQEGVARLHARIEEFERERAAELAKLDLTRGRGISPVSDKSGGASGTFKIVTEAMEMSLADQRATVSLDPDDLAASLKRISSLEKVANGMQPFFFDDLIYVIDLVGVKAKQSKQRLVARSFALQSLDEIPGQLQLGRPVLAGLRVFESWNRAPTLTTGVVSAERPGNFVLSTLGVILGMDRLKDELRVLTSYPSWGDRGQAILNKAAASQFIDAAQLRSIEAAPKPKPISRVSGP